MKNQYVVCNVGCDDETYAIISLTQKEYELFRKTFMYINKHSDCICKPKIFINPIDAIGKDKCPYSYKNKDLCPLCCHNDILGIIKDRERERKRR